MDNSQLLDTPTDNFLAFAQGADIVNWGDGKKVEFVGLFQNRVTAARYLLERTAYEIAQTAESRKFISQKHLRKLYHGEARRYGEGLEFNPHRFYDKDEDGKYEFNDPKVGGRSQTSLDEIAEQRAKAVLDELPALKTAVQIIAPDTAKMIERKEALLVQGDKIREEVEVVSEPILMADQDQNMTIGAFRALVKERDTKRKQLLSRLREIGQEGSELEETISKRLYSGIPGLSDAVVEVIKSHIDRSVALDEVSRRVEEQVRFGDSEAAVSLLSHFEQDEVNIGNNIRSQLAEALNKLKLSVRGPKKSKVETAPPKKSKKAKSR
jgi:hypothetical protein